MSYEVATCRILNDFETKPELLEMVGEQTGSRTAAITGIVATIAPNFILPDKPAEPGQIAQGLSEWHQEMAKTCSNTFKGLTVDPEGPKYSKAEANANSELQTLQAIRIGIKVAMNKYYGYARTRSSKPRWNRSAPILPYFDDESIKHSTVWPDGLTRPC